tara:strand:- start:224 stop:595 length:372 start_codon:yes stop_codon:yes gene_type:complete
MLDKLPLDIILLVLLELSNIKDILLIECINKSFTLDDSYYITWGYNYFGKEFWQKALLRSSSISNPLGTMKKELIRINKFQNQLIKNGVIWSNKDYYAYWTTLENIKKHKTDMFHIANIIMNL